MQKVLDWFLSSSGITTLIIIAVTTILYISLVKGIKQLSGKSNSLIILGDTLKYVIVAVSIIIILDVNGVNITKAVAGLGIASIIIGFALQDALKDIIMSIHIFIDEFYKIGDVIQYDGMEGIVIEFTIRTTKIKNLENGEVYSISNRDIEKVVKSSGICDILVPMSYDEDPDTIHELMEHICTEFEKVEHVLMGEFLGTQNFNDSSITYRLRFRCNPIHKLQTRRNCLYVVQKCLKEAGKTIPYNQLDIHSKG